VFTSLMSVHLESKPWIFAPTQTGDISYCKTFGNIFLHSNILCFNPALLF